MNKERVVDDIITKFFLNTSRLCPLPGKNAIQAANMCSRIASAHIRCPTENKGLAVIPLITGSMAEFYIEPMLPLIGDVDIMFYYNVRLAIPRGYPPPTQLPAEFHHCFDVEVYEIIDSDWSGYVYLRSRYLLTKCTDSESYNAVEHEKRGEYKGFEYNYVDDKRAGHHGPAACLPGIHFKCLPTDVVFCVRCLSWPTQAHSWPTRQRNNGWPDSATVDRVVSNGCDVVQVAHRECRSDELMSKSQWRLSFSRAEITLINSWMPVQQIVYHVLRVFIKTELLTESDDNSRVDALSNYHIKTLMLWACELRPQACWTDDLSLTRLCLELLHTLAVWLTEARCPHYFIDSCDLVKKSFAFQTIASQLLVDRYWLSSWFVNSYIRQSARICPENVSRLFDDVTTSIKLDNAVTAVVDWRINTTSMDMWRAFELTEAEIGRSLSNFSMNERSNVYLWMTQVSKADAHLRVYFAAVAFLDAAHKIVKSVSVEDLIKTLKISTRYFARLSNYYSKRTFALLYEVITLARECQTQEQRSTELVGMLQQFAVELLTTYRQLEARDFGSVATIVTTDFEALYAYKHGDYQRCLQLSTQNAYTLLDAVRIPYVYTFPVFIQLLDDDIVSLTALTLIVNPKCRCNIRYAGISQLTLSLYLVTQCQLKLRHSLTSLAQTLDYIEVAQRKHVVKMTLDHLILKLIERKLVTCIAGRNK